MDSGEHRKPSWMAKLILGAIALLTIVVVWAFVRSFDLDRDAPTEDQSIQIAPGSGGKPPP